MLTFKQFFNINEEYLTELKRPKRFFHIGPDDLQPGEDLKSLSSLVGHEEAKKIFKKKWGDTFSNDEDLNKAADEQTKHVHISDHWDDTDPTNEKSGSWKISSANKKAGIQKKLALYRIIPGRNMPNPIEKGGNYGGYKVKDKIPARYIRDKWDHKNKKWIPFNRQYSE